MYLYILFKVVINFSATTDFPSLCVEYIFTLLLYCHNFNDLSYNSLPLSNHVLFSLRPDPLKILWKASIILIPFLIFKGTTQAYLLEISRTHNKKQILYPIYLIIAYQLNQHPKYCS